MKRTFMLGELVESYPNAHPEVPPQGASFTRPPLECDHGTVSPYKKSMINFPTRRPTTTVAERS